MLLLAADENFNHDILRGLLRRNPDLDIVRVQDAGLRHAPDQLSLSGRHRREGSCLRMTETLSQNMPTNV